MAMDVARTKAAIGSGLLAFPVTHFDAAGAFDEAAYRANIRTNLEGGPAALFAPGGTGEFFNLSAGEIASVVKAAVDEVKGAVPVIAPCGMATAIASTHIRMRVQSRSVTMSVTAPMVQK